MSEHPIEGLMLTAMNSIKDMIDVNTIIGDPIQASNGVSVIPISKVSFGFVAGGSEFKGETIDEYKKQEKDEQIQYRLPFGGGAGAGVSLSPIAFLVIQNNVVKLLPVNHSTALDKILDYIPDLFEKVNNMANKSIQNKNILKIKFKGIFTFNIVNIMNMIKYIKRRVDKNGRTSYRRSYAYSNE